MKTKMKTSLLFVASVVFAVCLSLLCVLGFRAPAYTVSANSASSLKMENGAQVRLVANDPGLRFTASISTEEYEAVKAQGGTFGMFILPNVYNVENEISEATAFGDSAVYCWDSAVAGKTQIIHCSTDNLTQTSTDGATTYFACAITNIKTANYNVDFFARAYYEVNGERTWADANDTNVRSVSYVAQKVLGYENAGIYEPSATGKTALLEYVTQFVQAEVDSEGNATGEVKLYVADLAELPYVYVDGVEVEDVEFDDEKVLTLNGISRDRHTLTVEYDDGSTWDIPFVYADYVLRTTDDVANWINTKVSTGFNVLGYTVVANDITYDRTSALAGRSGTLSGTTFDGYGHSLIGFNVSNFGLLGTTAGSTTVKDLAMVNVTVSGFSGLVGTCGGKIENVFVSGAGAASYGLLAMDVATDATLSATISNCVVIDTKPAAFSFGRTYDTRKATTANNNLVITNGLAVKNMTSSTEGFDTARVNGENNVKLAPTATPEQKVAAFANFASGNWSFNTKTGELKLMGNTVYITEVPEIPVEINGTKDAQFITVSDEGVKLAFTAASIESVKVDGKKVNATFSNNQISLGQLATGRYTATVVVSETEAWEIPFVVADVVLRNTDDVINWITARNSYTSTDPSRYIVVANDITYDKASWFAGAGTNYMYNVTFDGYGHALRNFWLGNGWGIFGSMSSTCVLQDLALVDFKTSTFSGIYSGGTPTIKNVFISGTSAGYGFLGMDLTGTVSGCVVIDKNAAPSGYMLGRTEGNKATDNVVVTDGIAFSVSGAEAIDTLDASNVKLGTADTNGLVAALKALAAKDNSWTFDEATNTLYLMGNAVYTVA